MQNPDDYKEFQVLGANIQTILDGFGSFTLLASKILLEVGLGKMDDEGIGLVKLDPTSWYPVSALIRAMSRIQEEFGEYTIKQAGLYIVKRAKPTGDSHFQDIETAMKLMDAGYLINHAKNGAQMFNPQTGETMEGIGHYRLRPITNKNELIFDVDALYPCAFATGIVEGVALLFDPKAKLTHDPKVCRKKGSPICTYRVTYNIPGMKK
jgi:hypothetical protein